MSQVALLNKGMLEAGLSLPEATQSKLLDYLAMLQKWNKVYNLTAVRDPEQMVTLHLLDSLVVLPHIQAETLLDVGSGAGIPGILLAIARPDLQVTTLDTVQKKAIFMRQAKAELGLTNLEVVCERVESFQPSELFDVVISRAFSEIKLFLQLTAHLCKPHGYWLAMKGVKPVQELMGLQKPYEIRSLQVPGLVAERCLVVISNES